MKRFILAAALAVGLGLGFAGTADAQYVYRYNAITPNGGVVTNSGVYNGFATQQYNSYYSPYGGYRQQYLYGNALGANYGYSNGFNAWNGMGYNRGFYQPSPIVPFGGYNYGYGYNLYGRRW